MGRGSTELVKEAHDLIKKETGALVDTRQWIKAIDEMFERGLVPDEIMGALRMALADPWHRAKVMDWGLVHVNRNAHSLLAKKPESTPKPTRAYRELYRSGQHQRWDIENHTFAQRFLEENGRAPTLREVNEHGDRWYTQNLAIADEWSECPVCITEINLSKEVGLDPFMPTPEVKSLAKPIPEAATYEGIKDRGHDTGAGEDLMAELHEF